MALAVAAVAWGTAGCGDNSARCGEGTENVDGVCVAGGGADCGPGTTEVNDQCVPDGSVICEQGTVFDEDAGGCVPDASACADGTVLVDGQCVPEGTDVDIDHEEAPEPNDGFEADDDIAGQFEVPDIGADGVVLHGCVDPYRDVDNNGNRDIDYDMWLFQASGPMLVEITADGVGGLSAGYLMIPGSQEDLIGFGWQRFGLNLTGDTAKRQIYLPSAGVYALIMTDGRSLFLTDGAAGSPDSCYYTTIKQLDVPTPTPLTPNTDVAGEVGNESLFYSVDPADGSFFIGVETLDNPAAVGGLVAVRNGAFFEHNSAAPDSIVRTGGLHAADTVTYVVEPAYNYALDPVPFTLTAIAPNVAALPTDGTDLTVTNGSQDDVVAYFDIAADTMNFFDISSADASPQLIFIDDHGNLVTQQADGFADWVKFAAPGRYHVVISTTATSPATFTVTSTVTAEPVTTLPSNGTVTDVDFNALGAAWLRIDPRNEQWISFEGNATNWGPLVSLDFFDLDAVGVPEDDFGAAFFLDTPSDGSDDPPGHVVLGEGLQYIVEVRDFDAIADETSTFSITTADRGEDLGTVVDGPGVTQAGETLDATEVHYYLVRAAGGGLVTIEANPSDTADVGVVVLGRNENVLATANAGGAGATESVELESQGFVAFAVFGTEADVYDLNVRVIVPIPYNVTNTDVAYVDACTGGGAAVALSNNDTGVSAVQTMPFDFPLFGFDTDNTFQISANGWLAFAAAPTGAATDINAPIPTVGGPEGYIAPEWTDVFLTTVCRADFADHVTIQWRGVDFNEFPTNVDMQAILWQDGHIDFVYGDNQTSLGSISTIGVETLGGGGGLQLSFNETGVIAPGSSRTLTPAP
jgi:hypothetical protein